MEVPYAECENCDWIRMYSRGLGEEWREYVPPSCPRCGGEVYTHLADPSELSELTARTVDSLGDGDR